MEEMKKLVKEYIARVDEQNLQMLSSSQKTIKFRGFSCSVEGCIKSYSTKSHLDRHIKTVHTVQEENIIFSCPVCLKTYANRQNLKRHIKISHLKNEPFFCDMCKESFKKKHLLTSHMYRHTGIKAFSCELCSTDFISLHDKKKHMRVHKTYTCDECNMNFNIWSLYQSHKKSQHVRKEFICDTCGKFFKKRSHIVNHIKIHSVLHKVHICPYEDCHRDYTRRSNLKQHIKMKHEKITYDCTLCSTKLCTKANLQKHLKLHERDGATRKDPKTLATGRKPRKDKGILKKVTALKIAGLVNAPELVERRGNLGESFIYEIPINSMSYEQ